MSTTFSVSELVLRPIVFTRPMRLVDPTSWVPHIPFAFWLIDALRPRVVVELGTQSGNSFSAFAQAAQILGMESACYAVDTWKGDEQAGLYGEEVFQEWSSFHDPHFGTFSRLVRSTFDDALTKFDDASIDLLHIDGYHTYEAVRHDFESWLPKLSASAVVLLHDTNVRERDFGVWKFWEDLSHEYPCFAFLHGHGLGVVGVGRSLPPEVGLLVEHVRHQSQDAFTIRQFFGTLGEALLRQPREASQARIESELRSELAKNLALLISERERFTGWLTERDQQLQSARVELSKTIEVLTSERERFTGWLAERDQQLDAARVELGKTIEVLTSERERFTGWLTERDQQLEAARVQVSELSEANEEIRSVLSEITNESRHEVVERHQLRERIEAFEATIKTEEAEMARLSAARRLEEALQNREAELHLEGQIKDLETKLIELGSERSRLEGALRSREDEQRLERQQLQGGVKLQEATIRDLEAELAQLRSERSRLKQALQGRQTELDAVRSGLEQYRVSVTRLEQETARWFKLALRLKASKTSRASKPLRASVALARDLARRARFWRPLPAEATPMLASMRPSTRQQARAIRRSGLFDDRFYLQCYPHVVEDVLSPLMHFVISGARKGRLPHPLFDVQWYQEQAGKAKAGNNPLLHYLEQGVRKRRSPNRLFDVPFYLKQNPDVAAAGGEPLSHYLTVGAAKGSNPHPLFDTGFYLERNPDVEAAGRNPLEHYLTSGALEGRDPHPLFHTAFYLAQNPDVRAAKANPLVHFLTVGAHDGRDPNPWFDTSFYLDADPRLRASGENPLVHFLRVGAAKGRPTGRTPLFDVNWYLEQVGTKAGSNPLLHYLRRGVRKKRSPNRLFDVSFYLKQNPDVAASGGEPLAHYLAVGAKKGSNPHPLFDTGFYLEKSPDVEAAGRNPLEHYLASGGSEGRDPHPLFHASFYLYENPDVRATGENPLVHFLRVGAAEGRAPGPGPLFDAQWYLKQAGTEKAASNPLLHYLERGVRKKKSPNRLFDVSFYLKQNPDVAAGGEPLSHYLTVGAAKGSNPHPLFDTGFYLERNPDVEAAGRNPLEHYLTSGALEGRDPHPLFHAAFYLDQNPDVRAAKANPLVHFLTVGAHDGRDPNPWFDTSFYLDADPRLRASGENPLVHFLRVGAAEGRPAGPAFETALYTQSYPDVAASGLNPLTHFVLIGKAEGRRTFAQSSPTTTGARDIQGSIEAYETLVRRAREVEASRIAGLVVSPPAMIRLSPQGDLSSDAGDIVLRAEESPVVSIVIPVFNNVRLTLECLLSIVEGGSDVPFEVIVVDNASTDATNELLPRVPNLEHLRNEKNIGFGPACNQGAKAARGRYLVFLNNDAQVKAGWLPALLKTFSEFEHVGAVGPKVVFPDGRLQDAGSAVNADCTTTLIGVFDDPDLPRFNYTREVDYVSGVCLMIEAECFWQVGGFDDAFAPAYCEDVDLCLQLRQKGLRIIYQPSATVVHHLSVTSNALDPSFKIAAITRNQQKLSNRYQAQIDDLARARVIAFYLPQFHPIPENDVWWGKGFTEWRNVTRARPNFEGHLQPRLAADLGYYDLRLPETYVDQVALAERYGVSGFCFYYYWFDGKRLLERPLERLLEDGSPRFPFCVCWANENWTRRWDGKAHEVLMAQSYSKEDDVSVIADLSRYLRHPSYIRIGDRPLLLIYHASRFPDMRRTIETWRAECRSRGIGEIYLAMVQTFDLNQANPVDWGFDAAVEFPPHEGGVCPLEPARVLNPRFKGQVFDYPGTALHYMTRTPPGYRLFRTVMPGWDNTARRQDDSHIFSGSTPGAYQAWLKWALRQAHEQHFGDERLVFVNAWNEWAEGAYLEPDLGWGHAYLEATRDAQDNQRMSPGGFR